MEKEKKEKANELEKKVSTLTMCVVVMGVLLLSLGGYLVYDKVGNKSNIEGTVVRGHCGNQGIGGSNSIIRIVSDNIPIYDYNDRTKQVTTLNRGDELIHCSEESDGERCLTYYINNKHEFVDYKYVWINYDNSCRSYTYIH